VYLSQWIRLGKSRKELFKGTCHVPGNFLNEGSYRVMIMVVQDSSFGIYTHHDVLIFDVHDVERQGAWNRQMAGRGTAYV